MAKSGNGPTKKITDKICNHIRTGASYESAAQVAGISRITLYNWRKLGQERGRGKHYDFWKAVERANAECEALHAQQVAKAAIEAKIERQTITIHRADGTIETRHIEKEILPDAQYSLAILRARFPDTWNPNRKVELSTKDNKPLPLAIVKGMDPDEV